MIEALATVRRWGLDYLDPSALEAALRKVRAGTPVVVYIEPVQATRDAAANRFYWGWIVKAFADHTGYTPDESHAFFKAKFLPKELAVRGRNGTLVGEHVIGGTTTTLPPREFADYCNRIRQWMLEELDIALPDRAPRA